MGRRSLSPMAAARRGLVEILRLVEDRTHEIVERGVAEPVLGVSQKEVAVNAKAAALDERGLNLPAPVIEIAGSIQHAAGSVCLELKRDVAKEGGIDDELREGDYAAALLGGVPYAPRG